MITTVNAGEVQKATAFLEREILDAVQKELSHGLGEIIASIEEAADRDSWTEFLWFKQSFEAAGFGSASFGIEQTSALTLGKQLLTNGGDGEDDKSALNAIKEAFAQIGSSLATSFSARTRRPVRARTMAAQSIPPSSDQGFIVRIAAASQFFDITTCISSDLLEALVPGQRETAGGSNMIVPLGTGHTRNLDVLLDVEMPVSVSFGKTQLPLRDVFKLTTGSVVELNRVVSEPVDIVVNNSVIARGEVVVVEGNFGVRITQVISKQDRLKSLT